MSWDLQYTLQNNEFCQIYWEEGKTKQKFHSNKRDMKEKIKVEGAEERQYY